MPNFPKALPSVEAGFPDCPEKDEIVNFIRNSKRGIVRANDISEKGFIE